MDQTGAGLGKGQISLALSVGGRHNITFMTFRRQGYLCLPYMALQQHHLLSDVTVRGFVAGATNILFRQQRHLTDAIIDVSPKDLKVKKQIRCNLEVGPHR